MYPKYVMIDGERWDIKYTYRVGKHNDGLCKPSEKMIYIRPHMDVFDTLTTIIHEAYHAYEDERKVNMPHDWINNFDHITASLLLDNKQMFKRILD